MRTTILGRVWRRMTFFVFIIFGMTCAGSQASADNDSLRKQVEAITNSIAPFPKDAASDPALQKALKDLAEALQSVSCESFADPVDCYTKRVIEAVRELDKVTASKLPTAQKNALKNTIETLEKLVPPPPAPTKPVIDVIQAYYGDLAAARYRIDAEPDSKLSAAPSSKIVDTDRICSATQSMQAYCQGKQACWAVSDGAPARTGIHLCGYEPAPYAEPISKGLAVKYQCLDEVDLAEDPEKRAPPAKQPRVLTFRLGETARIICSGENK